MSKKVVVALSGGVDSSVAAALLQRQGYDVSAIFMKNWSPDTIQSLTDCPWEQDQADAQAVCERLGIPFRSVNFEREYKERVVDYFLREYQSGRTPNPDVMCNQEIKFKAFLELALAEGAEAIATGHYAQLTGQDGSYQLRQAVDPSKDQSYFLYRLRQDQLSKAIFPLGGMPKSEVRRLAAAFGLPTATKKDSQGICFIGHIDLKQFLMEQLAAKPGHTYLLPEYKEGVSYEERQSRSWMVGTHQGAMFYTLGERAGTIANNALYKQLRGRDIPPLYVLEKDAATNRVYVTDLHNDPHSYARDIILEDVMGDPSEWLGAVAQVRYHDKQPQAIESVSLDAGLVTVRLVQGAWAPAPGQSLVAYRDGAVLGGGVVAQVRRDG